MNLGLRIDLIDSKTTDYGRKYGMEYRIVFGFELCETCQADQDLFLFIYL